VAIDSDAEAKLDLDTVMKRRGWKLARADQPGIYVRTADTPAEDTIEFTFESPDMMAAFHARQARRKRVLEKWNARRVSRMTRAAGFQSK